MRLPRLRFTVRQMMVWVAVVAWAFGYRESLGQSLSPRSLLPPLTTLYLAWALLDAARSVLASHRRGRIVLIALASIFLTPSWCAWRAVAFHERSQAHGLVAYLYRLKVDWSRGVGHVVCLREHAREVLESLAESDMPRMIRLADHHDRLWEKYEQAARHPWLPIAPDPTEPE